MPEDTASTPPDGCPASAVIMAARQARTPLAIAQPDGRILFANDAFVHLVGRPADVLNGRTLACISASLPDVVAGTTLRFDLADEHGAARFPAALSIAAVADAQGRPLCLLCSLVDARGDGADAAIARDAELLQQVAQAAGELMRAAGEAAQAASASAHVAAASTIALDAVERAAATDRA